MRARTPPFSPSRRATLAGLASALAASPPGALSQPTPPTPWPEVAANLPGGIFSGSARLRFWGFDVYDAQLWVDSGFRTSRYGAHPLALSLTYLRNLRGSAIAERSIAEMRRQGSIPDALENQWREAMARLFPNVGAGDRLTGLWHPGEGVRFWLNAVALGGIPDDVFAGRFFGIWLSEATSEPDMRRALLAGAPA